MRYNDSVEIGNAIYNMDQEVSISPKLSVLVKKIERFVETTDYELHPMGSQIKNTALDGSDYDFLLLTDTGSHSPRKILNIIEEDFSKFQPYQGNHSIIIKDTGAQVDIVPGERTREEDLYKIPDRSNDEWIVRGQDSFIQDFLEENSRRNNRLQTVTKMLKLWKQNHPNFAIPSLALEKVVYDTLSSSSFARITHVKGTMMCIQELAERIKHPIKHPDRGPELNKLDEQERLRCSATLLRNYEQIKERKKEDWIAVFGPSFAEYL